MDTKQMRCTTATSADSTFLAHQQTQTHMQACGGVYTHKHRYGANMKIKRVMNYPTKQPTNQQEYQG